MVGIYEYRKPNAISNVNKEVAMRKWNIIHTYSDSI